MISNVLSIAHMQLGNKLIVTIGQRNLAEPVVGLQAFFKFDKAVLRLESREWLNDKFGDGAYMGHLDAPGHHSPSRGLIGFVSFIEQWNGQAPTDKDASLVRYAFTISRKPQYPVLELHPAQDEEDNWLHPPTLWATQPVSPDEPNVVAPNVKHHHQADVNMDGSVDLADFGAFARAFGQPVSAVGTLDLNHDGLVDLQDFAAFASQLGAK